MLGVIERAMSTGERDDRNRIWQAFGKERRALDRINGDIDLWWRTVTNPLADIEHRRLVFLAFADDDHAVHLDLPERVAHGGDRSAISLVLIAPPHPAGTRKS